MRRTVLLVVAVAAVLSTVGSASAEQRKCYTPHVGPFPTYEVCHYLPIDIEPQG